MGERVIAGAGSLTIEPPANSPDAPALSIRDARLVPTAGNTGELRMTVTNSSGVTEHLYGVATPHAAAVRLLSAPQEPGASAPPAPAAGITLPPHTTVAFGPGGPRIVLQAPTGLVPGHPADITLIFSVAGLVSLPAIPEAPSGSPSP